MRCADRRCPLPHPRGNESRWGGAGRFALGPLSARHPVRQPDLLGEHLYSGPRGIHPPLVQPTTAEGLRGDCLRPLARRSDPDQAHHPDSSPGGSVHFEGAILAAGHRRAPDLRGRARARVDREERGTPGGPHAIDEHRRQPAHRQQSRRDGELLGGSAACRRGRPHLRSGRGSGLDADGAPVHRSPSWTFPHDGNQEDDDRRYFRGGAGRGGLQRAAGRAWNGASREVPLDVPAGPSDGQPAVRPDRSRWDDRPRLTAERRGRGDLHRGGDGGTSLVVRIFREQPLSLSADAVPDPLRIGMARRLASAAGRDDPGTNDRCRPSLSRLGGHVGRGAVRDVSASFDVSGELARTGVGHVHHSRIARPASR
jgi:hypothetical protein